LTTYVFGLFSRKYELRTKVYFIDNDKIKSIKGEHNDKDMDVAFVSTNNVVTSWFLSNSSCQHGMMAVNLRGRLEGYEGRKAGNYENLIYYRIPDDCTSPVQIRKSIMPLKRSVTSTLPLPSWYQLARGDFAIVTNWTTFAGKGGFEIEGSKEINHIPLYDLTGAPSSIVMGIIYRYAPGMTAVLAMGTENQLKGLEDTCNFIDMDKNIDCHF
jgi:hypothetical protein